MPSGARRERNAAQRSAGQAPGPDPEKAKTVTAQALAEVGRRIREARLLKGLSIKELALATEIHPSFLSYLETGRKAPSMATLARLAEALGIALPRLFGAARPKPGPGEPSLDAFMRVLSGAGRKEKALCHEVLNAYAKLVRNRTVEQRTGILKGAAAFLYGLRKARRD